MKETKTRGTYEWQDSESAYPYPHSLSAGDIELMICKGACSP